MMPVERSFPMDIIPQVAEAMQTVLTTCANTAAKAKRFIKRERKLTGAAFVQTLVFGFLANAEATYEQLSQTAVSIGVEVTPQAIEQRLTEEASEMLFEVFNHAVEQVISTEGQAIEILTRFNGVYLEDSSRISLPSQLSNIWESSSKESDNSSSLKLHLRWEFVNGAIEHLSLSDGKTHDQAVSAEKRFLPEGSLRVADLGYFCLADFSVFDGLGIYWLTRLKANCVVFDEMGNPLDLGGWLADQQQSLVETRLLVGQSARLNCRLLAQRVDAATADSRKRQLKKKAKRLGRTPTQAQLQRAEWNLLITNVANDLLTPHEAFVVARVRWQIELLFKLWKSHGRIDSSTSQKPWRILCEVYAKLIAMIVQHWILLCGRWAYPHRSLTKAAKTIAAYGLHLAIALATQQTQRLIEAISIIARCLSVSLKVYKRNADPSTAQLLLSCTVMRSEI